MPRTKSLSDAIPLQDTLTFCPYGCGATVLVRIWESGDRTRPPAWRELASPLRPITGEIHHCDKTPT